MLYDGDCGFCRFWIARWRASTGRKIDYRSFQETAGRYPEIPRSSLSEAVQFIETDGGVHSGADAVFRALDYSDEKCRLGKVLRRFPDLMGIARCAYRFIARHRSAFSFLTRLFWGKSTSRPTYLVARWVFLRLLGVVYFVAFVSLLLQIRGLAGERGILPAGEYLQAVREGVGPERFWLLPTLCWISTSDVFLVFLCLAGAALSCAVAFGWFPSLCLFLCWALYLSLSCVGGTFLSFQWDALLLQAGFLSIFLTPPRFRPDLSFESGSSRVARWLLLWLLFCLVFESGMVKLMSGDESWRDFTALTYHYETQPLPIWTSWYMNQSPLWFSKLSVFLMFAAELGAPFSIFGPRNLRRLGCAAMILLQLLIATTGNYCFFNLLTIALALLLLDDDAWPGWLHRKTLPGTSETGIQWSPWVLGSVAGVDLLMSAIQMSSACHIRVDWPRPMITLYKAASPFRTFNGYGLFAVMTKERPEIIVEGSRDGAHWIPYEFKWKPGNLYQPPGLVAPFQPRLDWQMWFAALGTYQENPWFIGFLFRLLEGSPEVLGLLGSNPFGDIPPRYVRAALYDYRFTRSEERTGAWWKREYRGLYCPAISLSGTL